MLSKINTNRFGGKYTIPQTDVTQIRADKNVSNENQIRTTSKGFALHAFAEENCFAKMCRT